MKKQGYIVMVGFEVWPGPMEGVGSDEFALAVQKLRLTSRWMTPFIRLTDVVPGKRKLFHKISSYLQSGIPLIVQLMGSDPELLAQCGRILLDDPRISGINLNLGCPSQRVVKHHAGGGLLKDPAAAVDLCIKTASLLPEGKVSVKLRSGFADPEDMRKILPAISQSGKIAKIFFHYRTVTEAYDPAAKKYREERIAEAVRLCGRTPLIANGDISSVVEAQALVETTGCAGVMIARPWMRDPFLLRRFSGDETAPEEGREKFMSVLRQCGVGGGALIEMAKMLWGCDSPQFKALIKDGKEE